MTKRGASPKQVNLRSLTPLNNNAIPASIMKTGRTVVVTEGYRTGSFASEIAAQINDLCWDWLDAPVVRVGAADVPVPRAESLEDETIPNVRHIIAGCRQALR